MHLRFQALTIGLMFMSNMSESALAQGKKYAVCIGVNHYEHKQKLVSLKYAVNDAHDMADLFRQLKYEVIELTDLTRKSPTKQPLKQK